MNEPKQSRQSGAKGRKADAARQLRDNIRMLMNGMRDWVEEGMRPQGMTVAQLRLLFAIFKNPQGSSAEIARQCQVTPQTLQAMLQRAVREGWIVRRPAPHNARILISTLTRKGQVLLDRTQQAFAAFEMQMWSDASTAELLAVNTLLANALHRLEEAEALLPKSIHAARGPRKPKVAATR